MMRDICGYRADLHIAGDTPTPLEKLLTHRIVTNGLLVTEAETNLAQTSASPAVPMKHILYWLYWLYWEKRVDAAARGYLASIRALAQVRKLQMLQPPTMLVPVVPVTAISVVLPHSTFHSG